MIRKRTILSLALLATTAACGGGGGGASSGASGPAPAASAGGAPSSASMPSTNFSSPSVVMAADGTTTLSADQTSQTFTQTGTGAAADPATNTPADPVMLHVHINSGGVAYDGAYDITHTTDPTVALFNQTNFQEADGADGSRVFLDVTLSSSAYGIWQGPKGQVAAFAYGTDTPVGDIPKQGTATYKGESIGAGQTGGAKFNMIGDFAGTVDFSKGTLSTVMNQNVQSVNGGPTEAIQITGSGSIVAGTNKIAGNATATPSGTLIPTNLSGPLIASFFSPGAGQIGGVTNLSGGNTTAAVAFGGKQ